MLKGYTHEGIREGGRRSRVRIESGGVHPDREGSHGAEPSQGLPENSWRTRRVRRFGRDALAGAPGVLAAGRSDPRRAAARPLSREDRPHPHDVETPATRDPDDVFRPGDHAERGVLRPLPHLPRADRRGPRDLAIAGDGARGAAPRALVRGPQDQVPEGGGDRGHPVRRQQPGTVLAPRPRRAVGRRRYGECRMGGRAQLGPDLGRYSFREWSAVWTPPGAGDYTLMGPRSGEHTSEL